MSSSRKIFITGAIGCGKSFLSELISKEINIQYFPLDPIFFDLESSEHRKWRSKQQVTTLLQNILDEKSWIIEGWYPVKSISLILQEADIVIILNTKKIVRFWRIIKRFYERKLGFIPDLFPQGHFSHLINLLKWTSKFDHERFTADSKQYTNENCAFIYTKNGIGALNAIRGI